MKSMKTCTTSVVLVVLPLHHRREPVSGIPAANFGDIIFVDHAEIQLAVGEEQVRGVACS